MQQYINTMHTHANIYICECVCNKQICTMISFVVQEHDLSLGVLGGREVGRPVKKSVNEPKVLFCCQAEVCVYVFGFVYAL